MKAGHRFRLRASLAFLRLLLALPLLLAGTAMAAAPGFQGDGAWSPPRLLFEDREGFSRLDYMLKDPGDAIHIFWSHNPRSPYDPSGAYDESQTDIYYVRFERGEWLSPRDVLLNAQARMPFSALVAEDGILHLATTAGGPPCVNYLTVAARRAGDPRAWPPNRCLEDIGVGWPEIAADPGGRLYLLYPGRGQMTLELIRSSDGGRSWSSSIVVATVGSRDVFVASQRLVADAQGRLHAVWTEVEAPSGYPAHRLLYARSLDGGDTWSSPLELADARQADPNLIVHGDAVHVVWNGDAGYKGRYYRASPDGGLTWGPRVTLPLPATTGGLQGAPAIVADSTGTIHILYTDSPHLYYITLKDGAWSQPVEIAGPENTGATSEINVPMLVITGGNELHALYTRDAQAVYYQARRVAAPAEASRPFPQGETGRTPTPSPATVAAPRALPQAAVTPDATQPPLPDAGLPPPGSGSTVQPLVLSTLPALALVVIVLLRSYRGRRYR